jgi:hypothetical protein
VRITFTICSPQNKRKILRKRTGNKSEIKKGEKKKKKKEGKHRK